MEMGIRCGRALKAARVNEPVCTPVAPSPAMARPMMSVTDEGGIAQIRVPISKMKVVTRK